MNEVLVRLHKLVEMTKSPVEEEARTAALLAIKLILEHKIELRWPRPPSSIIRYVPTQVISTFNGVCKQCTIPYRKGDPILWVPHRGCTHITCQSYWQEL